MMTVSLKPVRDQHGIYPAAYSAWVAHAELNGEWVGIAYADTPSDAFADLVRFLKCHPPTTNGGTNDVD